MTKYYDYFLITIHSVNNHNPKNGQFRKLFTLTYILILNNNI